MFMSKDYVYIYVYYIYIWWSIWMISSGRSNKFKSSMLIFGGTRKLGFMMSNFCEAIDYFRELEERL